jgi:hypothetical protein
MVEALICAQSWLRSSPNKIDIRQTIVDLQKYEELAQGKNEFLSLNYVCILDV